MTTPSIRVSIPPSGQYARLVRAVATAAASRVLAVDRLEDLALAIDEACSQVLQTEAAESLDWSITTYDTHVDVVARAVDGRATTWPPPSWADSLEAIVLQGVASEVEVTVIEDAPGVRFRIG